MSAVSGSGRWQSVDVEEEQRQLAFAQNAPAAKDAQLSSTPELCVEGAKNRVITEATQRHQQLAHEKHAQQLAAPRLHPAVEHAKTSSEPRYSTPLMNLAGASELPLDDDTEAQLYIAARSVAQSREGGKLGVCVGDLVRIMPSAAGGDVSRASVVAYVMRRDGDTGAASDVFPQLSASDALASRTRIYGRIARAALLSMAADDSEAAVVIASNSTDEYAELIQWMSRSPGVVPDCGWSSYLSNSGIHFKHPRADRWQFYAEFWVDTQAEQATTSTGAMPHIVPAKTGGLSMAPHVDNTNKKLPYLNGSRRAQLCIEKDCFGGDMKDLSKKGMTQGVLIYLRNVSVDSARRTYGSVAPDETALRLALSALVLCYAETVSIVRKAIYANPAHPFGGKNYPSRQWDEQHTPYRQRFPLATPEDEPVRTLDLAVFAGEKAARWLKFEQAKYPHFWPNVDQAALEQYFAKPTKVVRRSRIIDTDRSPPRHKKKRRVEIQVAATKAVRLTSGSSGSMVPVATRTKLVKNLKVALCISWENETQWCSTRVLQCPCDNELGVSFVVDADVFTAGMHARLSRDVPCAVLDSDNKILEFAPLSKYL